MPRSCTYVFVHYVWGTWDRTPLITPELEPRIHACIGAKCRSLRCDVLAIGGTADHVHCLVRIPATLAVAELAKEMKGASSHLATHETESGSLFRWQGTYGAFSVGAAELERVTDYIRRQKEHHAHGNVEPQWECCMEVDSAAPCHTDISSIPNEIRT